MSRLTTYMTIMDREKHMISYKCNHLILKKLGIAVDRSRDKSFCPVYSCSSCAYCKHVPFDLEEQLTCKESNHE